ncbi:uncharacterized protein LOC129319639 [Prosopis cineraria]|uniref:uncharacterized protein LOC129319639 n=1 Tax=Prosopis cineraria TaxID=364024 RepID=UPI00240FDE18|nr:uncharacterized protein LOC129319639 [Prosopis cineraria]
MAENTRLKELSNDLKSLQLDMQCMRDIVERTETESKNMRELVERIEAASNSRLERLEKAIGDFLQAPNPRVDKLEATIENLVRQPNPRHEKLEARVETLVRMVEATQRDNEARKVLQIGSSDGGSGANSYMNQRQVKIDFPRFDGTDPHGWIFRAEQYFAFYQMTTPQRIILASIHMDGAAIPWFQMMLKSNLLTTWESLTQAIEAHFGPTQFEHPRSQLFKLTQTDSLDSYHQQFMTLANRTEGVTDDALLDCFVGGLKPKLRREVVARSPGNLLKAVSLARLFNEKYHLGNWVSKGKGHIGVAGNAVPLSNKPVTTTTAVAGSSFIKPSTVPLLPTPNIKPLTAVRKITPAEMQIRREKGLCYTCDEKFSPNHKCMNRQYMWLQNEDDKEEPESPPSLTATDTPKIEDTATYHHISLQAYNGTAGRTTIRFSGIVKGMSVQVLLDGGSSDSYIHPRVVKHLKVPVEPIKSMKVLVGNGQLMQGLGLVRELPVQICGQVILISAYVLEIAGSDIVIGSDWLATLGPHVADYSNATIKFLAHNNFVTLKGQKDARCEMTQLHQLHRIHMTKGISEVYLVQMMALESLLSLDKSDVLQEDLDTVLSKYSIVFETPHELPPSRECDHRIILQPGTGPVKVRPYRYPFSQKAEIERMVEELLQDGFIQPSVSPFSAPVLLVKKKDGSWRMCVDYRALNAITVKDSFPMPTVDELLDELGGSKYYSKLDLRAGYHQVRMHEADRDKTAFRTHQGLYEWLVMPFGLTNAPATFQALMNSVFKAYLRKFVLIFFDDILIYSATWSQHLEHIGLVLEQLVAHQLYAKKSKCSFGQTQIEYLGHVVAANGVSMDLSKVAAVQQWPTPANVSQLRGFLGLTGYYRRFIHKYASIAQPLTRLLQKNGFIWTNEAQSAFDLLKKALTEAPVLALPDFSLPFVVETDASGCAIGAVLSQNGHPIVYFSKQLSSQMQAQSAYVRELFAITQAVVLQTPEQELYLPKLLGYRFAIEYRPGKTNLAADSCPE